MSNSQDLYHTAHILWFLPTAEILVLQFIYLNLNTHLESAHMASKEPTQLDDSMMQGFVELPLTAEASGAKAAQDSAIDSHGHDTSIDHASDVSLERLASEDPRCSGRETGQPNTDPDTNGSSSVAGSPDSMLANAGSPPPRALTPDIPNENTHTDEQALQMSDEGSMSSHEHELEQVGGHSLEDAGDSATEHPSNGTFEMDP